VEALEPLLRHRPDVVALDKAWQPQSTFGRYNGNVDRLPLVFGSDGQNNDQFGGTVIELVHRKHQGGASATLFAAEDGFEINGPNVTTRGL